MVKAVIVISVIGIIMSFCSSNQSNEYYSIERVDVEDVYVDLKHNKVYLCYSAMSESLFWSPGVEVSIKDQNVMVRFVRSSIRNKNYHVDFEAEFISKMDTSNLPEELNFDSSIQFVRINLEKVKPFIGGISDSYIIDLSD